MGKVGNDECGGFGAMPFGLPRKGCVRGVANPRRANSPAVVCALRPQPLRGNVPHEKILNRFLQPCRQPRRLVDGALGIELARLQRAPNQVRLDALALQRLRQSAQRLRFGFASGFADKTR